MFMDAKTDLKARLPSRHVTEGPERAPHRSYYYAMGLTTAQIHQPFVGVATCWNEAAPCNIALMRQAQVVKKGVAAGGGTPRENSRSAGAAEGRGVTDDPIGTAGSEISIRPAHSATVFPPPW